MVRFSFARLKRGKGVGGGGGGRGRGAQLPRLQSACMTGLEWKGSRFARTSHVSIANQTKLSVVLPFHVF